jgi:hypothetical protein
MVMPFFSPWDLNVEMSMLDFVMIALSAGMVATVVLVVVFVMWQ